jgi:hypothetical protein
MTEPTPADHEPADREPRLNDVELAARELVNLVVDGEVSGVDNRVAQVAAKVLLSEN